MFDTGTVIDSAYRIMSAPREGGMAEIYAVVRLKDSKRAALKILKEEFRKSADALGRLNHEEEIGLRLKHRNIMEIYPHAGEKSFPYLVGEFVEGPTLAEFIAKHRWLALPTAFKIIMQTIDAVEYMHSQGIIHQDLKPENIVVLENGAIKIIDFGLAYYSGSKNVAWKNMLSIGGTVEYTSPQRLNGDITNGADVYALGIIMYQMLSGNLPYTGQEVIDYSQGKLKKAAPKPPSAYNKNIHPKLEKVIMRAVSFEKKDRYISATALGYALSKVADASLKYRKKDVDWLLIIFLVLLAVAAYIGFELFLVLRH